MNLDKFPTAVIRATHCVNPKDIDATLPMQLADSTGVVCFGPMPNGLSLGIMSDLSCTCCMISNESALAMAEYLVKFAKGEPVTADRTIEVTIPAPRAASPKPRFNPNEN